MHVDSSSSSTKAPGLQELEFQVVLSLAMEEDLYDGVAAVRNLNTTTCDSLDSQSSIT